MQPIPNHRTGRPITIVGIRVSAAKHARTAEALLAYSTAPKVA